MKTPPEIIGLIAPDAIRPILTPRATIATSYHDRHDWMDWDVVDLKDDGDDTFRFTCESSEPLRAECTVKLDRAMRVAVHRATLTSTSSARTRPMNGAVALCLVSAASSLRRSVAFTATGYRSVLGV